MNTYLKILLGVLLGITLVILGCVLYTGGSDATINLTLLWAYGLAALAIASAVYCAVSGMILSPGGAKKSMLSALAIVAVVLVSYFYAASHNLIIPNIETGGVFEGGEVVITEVSVIVAYILGAGAILAAVVSEVMNALK